MRSAPVFSGADVSSTAAAVIAWVVSGSVLGAAVDAVAPVLPQPASMPASIPAAVRAARIFWIVLILFFLLDFSAITERGTEGRFRARCLG